jgi:hypothetical protein
MSRRPRGGPHVCAQARDMRDVGSTHVARRARTSDLFSLGHQDIGT